MITPTVCIPQISQRAHWAQIFSALPSAAADNTAEYGLGQQMSRRTAGNALQQSFYNINQSIRRIAWLHAPSVSAIRLRKLLIESRKNLTACFVCVYGFSNPSRNNSSLISTEKIGEGALLLPASSC